MTKAVLKNAVRKIDFKKKDKEVYIPGLLGVNASTQLVKVPNRPSFVYVRLRSNQNELIQAFNDVVSPVYNLPVLVTRDVIDPTRYRVIGRDLAVYANWRNDTPYLPQHGSTHSIAPTGGGGDPVWVYGRQFMPLNVTPSGTSGGQGVVIDPFVYYYREYEQYKYAGGTGTASIVQFKPTNTNARMVLIYLDTNGNPQLMPGNEFSSLVTGTAAVLSHVPTINVDVGMPLAAARVVSGTSSILWNNLYDLRPIITGDDKDKIGISNSGAFSVSGTAIDFGDNLDVVVSGTTAFVSATASGGGGGGGTITIRDDGVFRVSGTVIDFMNDLDVVVTGSTAFVSWGGCVTHECTTIGFRIYGGTSTVNYLIHESAFQLSNTGDARGTNAVDLQKVRTSDSEVASGLVAFLGGGSSNRAGGASSGVVGGDSNNAHGTRSFIGGGQSNTNQGASSVILGGNGNTINTGVTYGTILSGGNNIVAANNSVAMGSEAQARSPVQFVQGVFPNGGNSSNELQASRHILGIRQAMVTGTWYSLQTNELINGLSIPTNSAWTFEVLLTGATQGMDTVLGYRINGVIENDGGITTLLASNVTTLYEDVASFDARVLGDDTNDRLQVQVMQSSGSTVTVIWVASILTAEVNLFS